MNTTSSIPAPVSGSSFDRRALIVLLLSVAGGSVDAVIIMGFHVLTAAQTGNTILLAVSLAQGRFMDGLYSAISVLGYVVGAAIGQSVIDRRSDSVSRRARFDWALLLELIALSMLLGSWRFAGHNPAAGMAAVLIGLAAVAMGIQSADALRLHVGPKTTYVTGTLTTFATKAVSGLHKPERAPVVPESQDPTAVLWSNKGPLIYGVDWLLYAGGACLGGLLFLRLHETALALPIIAIFAAMIAGVSRRRDPSTV